VCSVWVWAAGLTAMPQLGLDAGRLPTVSETLGHRESQAESRSPSPARHEGGPREDSHGDDGRWCFACLPARTGWVFTLLFVLALLLYCVTPCVVAFAMYASCARVVHPQRHRRHLPPCCSRGEAQTAAGTRRHFLKKFPHLTVWHHRRWPTLLQSLTPLALFSDSPVFRTPRACTVPHAHSTAHVCPSFDGRRPPRV
jgi:hypothetical protein